MIKEVQLHRTTDYSQFADINANREVDTRHVRALMKAIQETNLLHLNPIIVNTKMEVIDGQHRLAAAKELELEVFYLIDDQIGKTHIAKLNSNQKNWTMLDYVNYYAVEKIPEYLELSDLINRNPHLPVTTLIRLIGKETNNLIRKFKEGSLDVSNRDRADLIIAHVDQVRNLGIEFAYDRNFIMAIKDVMLVEGYDADQFLAKLRANRLDLVKASKKVQYLQQIEQIYNKHQQKRIRFY